MSFELEFVPDPPPDPAAQAHWVECGLQAWQYVPLAAIDWDMQLRITRWSPQAEALFGWHAAAVLGKTIESDGPFATGDQTAAVSMFTPLLAGKEAYSTARLPTGTRSGKQLDCEWHNAVLVDETGKPSILSLVLDRTRQQQPSERLRLLESVIVHANDGVLITEAAPLDLPGPRILYANTAFSRMTGYSLADLLGKTPRILQGPKTDPIARTRIRTALAQREPILVELVNYRKDGSEHWVELSIVPVVNEDGDCSHMIAIQRDIDHRKRLEAELRRALAAEKELNELKSHFVAMASHEFRTPLSTILAASELLEHYAHQWTEAERLEPLHLIQDSVQHITKLLEDILYTGEGKIHRVSFQPRTIELETFGRKVINQLQLSVGRQHSLTFANHCASTAAWLDEKLLQQIVTNLLSNAVKYSPPGSAIQFELSEQDNLLRLIIRDQGIGIPPEDLPRLFEEFHRARNVGTIPGTGLGLAIVKQCVDAHGGSISVDSTVGCGTTFEVMLPMSEQPLSE